MMREPAAGHIEDIAAAYSLCVAGQRITRCDVKSCLADMTSLVACRCARANIRALPLLASPLASKFQLRNNFKLILVLFF